MINLIPINTKKSITMEYWLRVVTVWAYLFSAALLVSIIITIPAYVLIDIQVASYENEAQSAEKDVLDFDMVSKELTTASRQAVLVINDAEKNVLSNYINLINQLEGPNIAVNNITLARAGAGVAPITITGEATDRASLAEFRDRLLNEESVLEVNLPISNLAQDRDIQFTITVTMNNEIAI